MLAKEGENKTDFLTEKIHRDISTDNNLCTEVYQKHIDCGYGYKFMFYYVDKYILNKLRCIGD